MKNDMKRWFAALLSVIVVGSMCYLSYDYQLKASEGDGTSTAIEQQHSVEEASKPVEVVVPAKPAEEPKQEEKKEEIKEEVQEAPKQEEKPAAEASVEDKQSEPAPVSEEPAEEEQSEPAPIADEPAEEPAEEPVVEATEAPAAEEAADPTEAPAVEESTEAPVVEEATEAPAAEESADPTEAPAAEETEQAPEASAEATPEASAEPEATPAPQISVSVRLANSGELYFGDTVELRADVEGAGEMPYTIQWQYNNGSGWKNIGGENGKDYRFELTEENALYGYRAVVIYG